MSIASKNYCLTFKNLLNFPKRECIVFYFEFFPRIHTNHADPTLKTATLEIVFFSFNLQINNKQINFDSRMIKLKGLGLVISLSKKILFVFAIGSPERIIGKGKSFSMCT